MTGDPAGEPTFTARDRRALQSIAVQFFVNGAIFASFIPRLPEIRDRIDVGVGAMGVLLAVSSGVGLLGSLTVGWLVERFGSRLVLIGAAACLTASLLIVAAATDPVVLAIGLCAMSTLDVYVDGTMNLQGSWLSARRHAPVMNRLHGLWSLGTVVGGLGAAQAAAAGISLSTHLVVVAALLAGVLVFVGRGLLRVDEHVDGEPDDGVGGTAGAAGASNATGASRSAARSGLVVLGVLAACSIAMEMTSSDWAAFRLSDDLGTSAGVGVLGYVAFTAGMTSGRLGGDGVLVRFGRERLFRIGLAATVVGLVVATLVDDVPAVIVGYLVAGIGIATQFPRLYDEAAQRRGRPGAGLGALTAGSRLALLVAPLAVGAIADTAWSVGAAVAVVTLPAAAVFALLARPSRTRPAADQAGVSTASS